MIKVLVVDDSHFFRKRITACLNADPEIAVIGEAPDGEVAIEKTRALQPDVITMDIEMPNMDGIEAVKRIMAETPTPILMLSSLTREGANATLEALNAGAADFLTKDFKNISLAKGVVIEQLCERVRALGGSKNRCDLPHHPSAPPCTEHQPAQRYGLALIGASTGGPVAVEKVLTRLPKAFHLPIVLIQHMPSTFTQAFAARLNKLCAIEVKEAEDGDRLQPGTAYIAPGGRQTYIKKNGRGAYLKIGETPAGVNYRPCVDITFNSAATAFQQAVLAIVMTGMGSDGCAGAGALKRQGATIWAQDEASSVIYGMPMAVAKASLADSILPLDAIGQKLASLR